MNTYEIRAISPTKTVVKQVSATSAKFAEKRFRRSHTRNFEEIRITRVNEGETINANRR
jgi:hypothetical protein